MSKAQKKSRQLGVWIPRKIQKSNALSDGEKLLFAYFWSFKGRGCWQTDEQLAKEFGRCPRTMGGRIANLDKAGLLYMTGRQSQYRRIWAKDHPSFKAGQRIIAAKKEAEAKEILLGKKLPTTNKQDEAIPLGNILPTTPQKTADSLGNKLPTTNKYTNKETIKHGEPSPLPAEGQAQASPQRQKPTKDEKLRSIKQQSEIEQQIRKIGKGPPVKPLSEKEFAERRDRMRKALGV